MPMTASAALVSLTEGGAANSFTINDALFYAEAPISGAGVGSRTFSLDATPPQGTALSLETSTLEFVGQFSGLSVTLDGASLVQVGATATSRVFGIDSIFDATNGFSKTLVIAWTNIAGQGAGILIQAQASAVPIPAAGLLLLTALGGAAAMRRRKTVNA